jgi:hypothetical protein
MSQYGYNSSNAATFNQLVRTGLTTEEAAAQSGVSTNAGQYGFGTNSNAGAVISGAGGTVDPDTGLLDVPYTQSGTGEPAQQPAQIIEPPPTTNPITESQSDSRIISSTPSASSGFGYGTGINNPSVAPTTAADTINANTSGLPIFNEEGTAAQGILQNPETGETYYTTVTDQQRVASEQAATIDANTSGIPIRNEEGEVVQGIRTNPETGETYYTDSPDNAAEPRVASFAATDVSPASLGKPGESLEAQASAAAGGGSTPIGAEISTPASLTESGKLLAQRQAALAAQKKLVNNNGDWRVRISLADSSDYLYNAPFLEDGILAPLKATFGVIFPYTPTINVGYKATYNNTDLTHSN